MAYDLGQTITVRGRFKNKDRQLTNPTNATLTVEKPDGTTQLYNTGNWTIVSPGIWDLDVVLDLPGDWDFRIQSTGAVASVKEWTEHVRTTLIGT